MTNIEFGKYLAQLREQAGYETQAALGRASGVESSTISRIESGDTRNPNIQTLEKIAPYLKVSKEELLMKAAGYIAEEQPTEEIKTSRLIKAIARAEDLPKADIDEVADLLEYLIQKKKNQQKKEN